VSLSPFTMAAIAEAGLPVKSGAGQDRAGSFRTGLAGSDALKHHGSPVEQLAGQRGAGAPRTPPDLREHTPMSDSSRGNHPPLEKSDMPPCGAVLLFRLEGGQLLAKRAPCRTKACETCGPRMRARWAAQWAHAMAGDRVQRLVVDDAEYARLRRRKMLHGHELGQIPAPGGRRAVYTTAELGEPVTGLIGSLTRDFAAMPNDGRHSSLTGCRGTEARPRTGWLGVIADMEEEAEARQAPPGECLGRLRRDVPHVAMVASDLGLLVGRTADAVVMAAPTPAVFRQFIERVGIWWTERDLWWAQRGEEVA
jgi:hypothetical protein